MLGGEAGVGQGFKYFMSGIEVGRVNVAARGVGVAQAALDDALRYAQEREAFGKPIAQPPGGPADAREDGDARRGRAAARSSRRRRRRRRGERADLEAGMAKYFATEAAQENALDCMRIHGGYGYSLEYRPERYYRDAPLLLIGEGSNEIQQLIIARRLLERTRLTWTSRSRPSWRRSARPCASSAPRFPGEYWRALEPDRYPEEFVAALTEDGWLAALVPEEYGGAGLALTAASVILEEINASGCNSGACHAQMYTMGTILRHGSDEQKQRYLPRIASGELRLQAFGVTEPTAGSDTTSLQTTATRVDGGWSISGQKIWTSRAEHSDLMLLLARTTPADQVEKRTEGLSTFLVDMKRARRRRDDDDPADPDADEPRDDRDLPRRRVRRRTTTSSARRARASATSSTA